MTIKNLLGYRESAENMMKEAKDNNKCNEYYYLKEWIERFDNTINGCTCYPEHRVEYIDGMKYLTKLATSL